MNLTKKLNGGGIIVILLSIIPIIIWASTAKIASPFGAIENFITSFGEIAGLAGIVIFSFNFILSARLRIIEKLFGGLNNVYKRHSLLGQLALILLLFHPLLLLPRYAANFKEGASFLFLGNLWSRNFGIMALWIIIVAIILTLYLRPKYNLWKITHKFLGLALFFGALHAYLIPGYVMQNLLLKGYVLFLAVSGLTAFLYRSVFGAYLVKRYKYVVENISLLNSKVVEISLRPLGKGINYLPGQFLFISFKEKELSEEHPFSISSSPNEELLKVTIKNLGDYTKKLPAKIRKGTIAKIEGPFGVFYYAKTTNKNQIWIAGGIGITPFLSFAKSIDDSYNITLFYSVGNRHEAVYLELLAQLAQKNNNFSVVPFYSEEKGHIDAEYLSANIKNLGKKAVFICAPAKMIKELKNGLTNFGVNRNNIYSEEFNL